MQKRSFLFLQSVCSPFFRYLADRLEEDGHRVSKIHFNGGDVAYWRGQQAFHYQDCLENLPEFIARKCDQLEITDQVLFGDRRPVHRPAVDSAERNGVRTHVFEEGYFRPYWITLERDGVNAHSLLPRDPDWFREVGKRLPEYGNGESFHSPFWLRAWHDVAYHLASCVNPIFFPKYRTHAPYSAPVEYMGYSRRFTMLRFVKTMNERRIGQLIDGAVPFYLLPLQLSSDAQIRDHSSFENMAGVIRFVMESFAKRAPIGSRLVIKNHPLDIGIDDHAGEISRLERLFGIEGRVEYLESGDLDALLRRAKGVVTVNSTVGSHAVGFGCPTITLSNPIYNLPGLTFQGTLDEFWSNATRPDSELFRRFRNTVIHATQVNGGFYSMSGIRLAVENSCRLLVADQSPLEALMS